jgi:hypothetical protein
VLPSGYRSVSEVTGETRDLRWAARPVAMAIRDTLLSRVILSEAEVPNEW